jgi:hypothetical protein
VETGNQLLAAVLAWEAPVEALADWLAGELERVGWPGGCYVAVVAASVVVRWDAGRQWWVVWWRGPRGNGCRWILPRADVLAGGLKAAGIGE